MPPRPSHDTAPPSTLGAEVRLRNDLVVAEIDDDVVVFDPVRMESHVLAGGAAVVWSELVAGRTSSCLAQRVARRTGLDVERVAPDVAAALLRLIQLGLVEELADTRGTNAADRRV